MSDDTPTGKSLSLTNWTAAVLAQALRHPESATTTDDLWRIGQVLDNIPELDEPVPTENSRDSLEAHRKTHDKWSAQPCGIHLTNKQYQTAQKALQNPKILETLPHHPRILGLLKAFDLNPSEE